MADLRDLTDLLYHEIQVLYAGEELLIDALPRMASKANDSTLKAAFEMHLDETKQQRERLKQAADLLSIDPDGDGNPSMKGLIAEGEKVMHKDASPEALDAALISCAQKVEHYEISGYGTAAHLADGLGLKMVAELLRQTLQEEQNTDTKLNDLAKSNINRKAAQAS
jgi:ferritin-like metal-binding protein YciE